jgi:hypothetical protein
MAARFLLGLIAGGVGSGITWVITQDPGWTAVIGIVCAAFIWFGELLLDDLL